MQLSARLRGRVHAGAEREGGPAGRGDARALLRPGRAQELQQPPPPPHLHAPHLRARVLHRQRAEQGAQRIPGHLRVHRRL